MDEPVSVPPKQTETNAMARLSGNDKGDPDSSDDSSRSSCDTSLVHLSSCHVSEECVKCFSLQQNVALRDTRT